MNDVAFHFCVFIRCFFVFEIVVVFFSLFHFSTCCYLFYALKIIINECIHINIDYFEPVRLARVLHGNNIFIVMYDGGLL